MKNIILLVLVFICLKLDSQILPNPNISDKVDQSTVDSIWVKSDKPFRSLPLEDPVFVKPSDQTQDKWNITYKHVGNPAWKNNLSPINQERLLRTEQKLDDKFDDIKEEYQTSARIIEPIILESFKGNTYTGWAPLDNSIAVSNGGYIVSVANSSIQFSNTAGSVSYDDSFNNFLSFLEIDGFYFDPRVIYDPIENKFIVVV